MTEMRTYVKLGAALAGAAVVWGAACGGSVVLEPDTGEGGGTSASSATMGTTTGNPQGSTGAGPDCTEMSCTGLGTNACTCERTCGFAKLQSSCALNEDKVLVCVCTYDEMFSGTCFEKTQNVCDIDKGCCAKYFQGI